MKKVKVFGFLLIIAMVLGLALPGCRKPLSPSTLPFEAIHLGNDLFVIVKTTEETKENLHLPLVARFDSPQDIQVGDVMALAFDQLMESFPPQAVIVASEKLSGESKTYLAGFGLAHQLLQIRPEKTYLIDVRTVEEFEAGHVPESINIPVDQINDIVDSIPDQDSTLLLYCRSGRRSATAAKVLQDLGYRVIFDLGGISDYKGDLEKGGAE
ncbi:MAG: rhodanese-like domain-containing protein [Saccharofermentanales bacterium]|jgi:rhodanese-related sulfurtransferase|nr:rhodanese-like domain-containing protein [Clostridiaceae bacterium]